MTFSGGTLPKVAYFSMEIAMDQTLYTYSGGLGYLAGSHMLSAGRLGLPMVGVTILWSQGYGYQVLERNECKLIYKDHTYPFLKDTGVTVVVEIFGQPVRVKALLLPPEHFNSAPVYFLTTDIPENTEDHRKITRILYDGDENTRIAQEIILGMGGLRVLRACAEHPHIIHLNEGHALPAAFELLNEYNGNLQAVRERVVFTTHTPVAAGNESHPAHLLAEAGFFGQISLDRARHLGGDDFCLTVAALRMSRMANGVSQLHGQVANNMWDWVTDRCPIIAITNATNREFWQDPRISSKSAPEELLATKKTMKAELFDRVKQETGKAFNPDVLTIVWARRFTDYKRAWLIFKDEARLRHLLETNRIQLLFAGKFHPKDTAGHATFNRTIEYSHELPNLAILPNYDMGLSGALKRGADVWLNTPLRPMEASGTSGMSANMNGAIHLSTYDGWAVEGTFHGINGYIINVAGDNEYHAIDERHQKDYESMMGLLEETIIPMYYDSPEQWAALMQNALQTAETYFHSDRMVVEYYVRLYQTVTL